MENAIGADTVDYGRPRGSARALAIVPCALLGVKKREGSYDKKGQKKFKKVKQEYQK